MSGANPLGAGMDVTHVAPQDAAARRQRQRDARALTAAITFERRGIVLPDDGSGPEAPRPDHHEPRVRAVVEGEIAELLDALGLNPPTDLSGHCACGVPLPMASYIARGEYRHGRCYRCSVAGGTP